MTSSFYRVLPEHQRIHVPKETYTLRGAAQGKGKMRLPVPKALESPQQVRLAPRNINRAVDSSVAKGIEMFDSPVSQEQRLAPPSDPTLSGATNSAVKKLLAPFSSSEKKFTSMDETKISDWMMDQLLNDSKVMMDPIRFGHDTLVSTTSLLKALENKVQRKWRKTQEKITLISFLKDFIVCKGATLSVEDHEIIRRITDNILQTASKDLHLIQLQSIALEIVDLLTKEYQKVKPFNQKLLMGEFVSYESIEIFYLLYKTIDLEALSKFASDLKNEAERLFINIPLKEFIEYPTTPRACTNITAMLTHFTKISDFTRIQILADSSAKSLEKFILFADASFQINDWLTCLSILASLVFTDVKESDLPEAWKGLTPETRTKFAKLQAFFTNPGSFKERLKTLSDLNHRNIACIPDLLSFLREMKLANGKQNLIDGKPNTKRLKDFAEIIGALFHAQEKISHTSHYRKSDIMAVINQTTLEPRP